MRARTIGYSAIIVLILAVLAGSAAFIEPLLEFITDYVETHYVLATVLYIIMVVMSVLIAPFNLPLFYVAGTIWGPPLAALYNIFGWSVGAALAFWVARRFGKPFVAKFLPIAKIEAYESKIPPRLEFFGVVLLRIITPVDILSYTLGIFTQITFRMYMGATIIGITPFAVMFAYGGEALLAGNYFLLVTLAALALLVAGVTIYLLRKMRKKK